MDHPLTAQLRARRRALRINQDVLARHIGYAETTISNAERGVCNPTLSFLEAFAAGVGLELTLFPISGHLPDHLQGDGPCQDCGTPDNIRWFAPSVLWNHVMGGPEAMGDPGGVICIPCFIKRTDAAGLAPVSWQLVPQWRWTEKATTGPNPDAAS